VLSANGLDELFCGYDAYRRWFPNGALAVTRQMQRLVATARADKAEVDKLAATFGVDYRCPFLAPAFVRYAMTIPLSHKIHGADDTMRKHVLRTVARAVGVPDAAAYRPKKAFQYSSGIHRALRRLATQRGYTRSRAVQAGYRSALEAYLTHLTRRIV
jgi:asparagine synthase (glutamine-hydrolysing)